MNITTLLKLAGNPHYKLSPTQLEQLEEYRKTQSKHNPHINRHPVGFKKHNPKMEEEELHG